MKSSWFFTLLFATIIVLVAMNKVDHHVRFLEKKCNILGDVMK